MTETGTGADATAAANSWPNPTAPSETVLSSVLRDFARTMLTDRPIQEILDRLVERSVDVLPISAAAVTLITPDSDAHHVAASDRFALHLVQLQTQLGEGPCLAAYHSGRPVLVPDLAPHSDFAAFRTSALLAGLGAVFTFPLHDGEGRLGALDLYRDTPGPLGDAAVDAAEALADVTAAYIRNARTRTDLRAASERSRTIAMHDALTGLPNRALLLERLAHAIDRGARSTKVAAVLFADLDGFKAVNDRLGHLAGDELLVQVARRLEAAVRPGDTLARIAGDEFVILCEDLDDEAEAAEIASRLIATMDEPFALSRGTVRIGMSVGVARSSPGAAVSVDLLERADRAMYQAKRRGNEHRSSSRPERRPHTSGTSAAGGPHTPIAIALHVEWSGGGVTVTPTGEIDSFTAPILRAVLTPLAHTTRPDVVLDLGTTDFIDAACLGVIATTAAHIQGAHGSFALRSPRPAARRLLAITRLDTLVEAGAEHAPRHTPTHVHLPARTDLEPGEIDDAATKQTTAVVPPAVEAPGSARDGHLDPIHGPTTQPTPSVLEARTVIAQAQGVIMARHGVSAETAFAAISRSARAAGQPVEQRAAVIVAATRQEGLIGGLLA